MAVRQQRQQVDYGLTNALQAIPPQPIIALRDPSTADYAEIGTIWINKSSNNYFVLTSITAGSATWQAGAGGAGDFTSITVNPGDVTVTAGNVIAGNSVQANAGNITAVAGNVTAQTGVTANTGNITATTGNFVVTSGTASFRFGTTGAQILSGAAAPNGAVTGTSGSIYLRTGTADATTTLYVNTSVGSGTTWVVILPT